MRKRLQTEFSRDIGTMPDSNLEATYTAEVRMIFGSKRGAGVSPATHLARKV